MMKHFITILFAFFFCMLSPNIVKGQSDGAVISISASANAPLMKGYGIIINVTNIETDEVFVSKSLNGISKSSIIENLPAGKYVVTFAEIPFGSIKWRNWSPELQRYFGIMEFNTAESYYLGSFEATFEGGLKDRRVMLNFMDSIIPKKLMKYFRKHNLPTKDIKCIEPLEKSFVFARPSL